MNLIRRILNGDTFILRDNPRIDFRVSRSTWCDWWPPLHYIKRFNGGDPYASIKIGPIYIRKFLFRWSPPSVGLKYYWDTRLSTKYKEHYASEERSNAWKSHE